MKMGTEAFVQLPLAQMVDLVVNSPEPGIINFGLLHAALQVIVQRLNAQDLAIEIHGNEAAKLTNILKSDIPRGSYKVHEMLVKDNKQADSLGDMVIVVTPSAPIPTVPTAPSVAVTAPSIQLGSSYSAPLTKTHMDNIYNALDDLRQQIRELRDMPGNSRIIDAVRSDTNSPVLDMLQLLSLSKRIEGAEDGMTKLTSLVEEAIKSPLHSSKSSTRRKSKSKTSIVEVRSSPSSSKKDKSRSNLELKAKTKDGPRSSDTQLLSEFKARMQNLTLEEIIPELIDEVDKIKKIVDDHFRTDSEPSDSDDKKRSRTGSIGQLFSDVADIKEKLFRKKKTNEAGEEIADDNDLNLPPDLQLSLLEERFRENTEHLDQLDQTFNDELSKLHNQFTDIEKDFNEILSKIQTGFPGDKSTDEPNQCCAAVYQKIVQLQSDFEQMTDTSLKLMLDKDEKQKQMDEMLENIELLKTIKADKEDIEEALADKADACAVHRKVSHDKFDSACDELSKGIEEALEKLSEQEKLWQQALDDIQSEIGNKLDKMDLGPLREFINNKLRMLQDKMKSLAALKKEQEAAGTKNKLLRDVNCISCDKDVVMRKEMDPSMKAHGQAVPPTRSMGPYLAYELDNLRKQQKSLPGSKNLNNYEHALNLGKGTKKGDDHVCNRYCGGSHTITTPQQRVTRLGHFLMQWGPESMPQTESKIGDEKRSTIIAPKQSVIVQGLITTTKKSAIEVLEEKGISKSTLPTKSLSQAKPPSKTSITRAVSAVSGRRSTDSATLKRPASADAKQMSHISVKSAQKSTSSVKEKAASNISNRMQEAPETIVEETTQMVEEAVADSAPAETTQKSEGEAAAPEGDVEEAPASAPVEEAPAESPEEIPTE